MAVYNVEIHIEDKPSSMLLYGVTSVIAKAVIYEYVSSNVLNLNREDIALPENDGLVYFDAYEGGNIKQVLVTYFEAP